VNAADRREPDDGTAVGGVFAASVRPPLGGLNGAALERRADGAGPAPAASGAGWSGADRVAGDANGVGDGGRPGCVMGGDDARSVGVRDTPAVPSSSEFDPEVNGSSSVSCSAFGLRRGAAWCGTIGGSSGTLPGGCTKSAAGGLAARRSRGGVSCSIRPSVAALWLAWRVWCERAARTAPPKLSEVVVLLGDMRACILDRRWSYGHRGGFA
jgi:hypothetical protein